MNEDTRDPKQWHGHRIMTEDDLIETFEAAGPGKPRWWYFRRVFHGLVLVLLLGLLGTAVWAALAVSRGELEIPGWAVTARPNPALSCPTEQLAYPATTGITVNVYNSTRINGLAKSVAAALKERGYLIGEVGNKSLSSVRVPAAIVSGPAGRASALNLQRNIAETEYVDDAREDATVDVVVGTGYKGLVAAELVSGDPGQLSCPRLSPGPVPEPPAAPVPSPVP